MDVLAFFPNHNEDVNEDKVCIKAAMKNKRQKPHKPNTNDEKSMEDSSIVPSASIVMDVFQGGTITSVKCLSCEKVFHRKEVFLDLSLPIATQAKHKVGDVAKSPPPPPPPPSNPSRIIATNRFFSSDSLIAVGKQLFLHPLDSSIALLSLASLFVLFVAAWVKRLPLIPLIASYFAFATSWVKSLIWTPHIELEDCLDAFFDVDELAGENQYHCEHCSRHTNGRMHIELTKLPEVLCLHLKRFRHDFISASKIYSPVDFPLRNLDLSKYLHPSCRTRVALYDLVGVVCHSGTVRCGHYYAYAQNQGDNAWYEFNDSSVLRVDDSAIPSLSSSAYILVYRKQQTSVRPIREKFLEMEATLPVSSPPVYISRHWLLRFANLADPGPISNSDFLCSHGAFQPLLASGLDEHVAPISLDLWNFVLSQFGGGPLVTSLQPCEVCVQKLELLDSRRNTELKSFQMAPDESESMFVISSDWFKSWAAFVCGREIEPPGPISNSVILEPSRSASGTYRVRFGIAPSRYNLISEPRWRLLSSTYGGGPEHSVKLPAHPVNHEAKMEEDQAEFVPFANSGKSEQHEAKVDDEGDNRSSSSTSFYPEDDGSVSSSVRSARDTPSLSPSPPLPTPLETHNAGPYPLSENTSNSNSPVSERRAQQSAQPPRPASVVFLKPESSSAGDGLSNGRCHSATGFATLNGDSKKPILPAAFGDEDVACDGGGGDTSGELKGALQNGSMNCAREDHHELLP
ncbi:unnamed protein product [Mesocestoides corti]|uniref:ubiquitinyl hydrolase 1 n=1 Tax=Mesocestoides corti TaxID=53468 RepID=A0A0R3UGC1_MESCO|nr:unnamed protein product [Mesocestoides corti]